MKKTYIITTLIGLTLISCKDDLKPQESFVDYSAKTNTPAPQTAATPGMISPQQVATTTSKINPPHGQPGHVCRTETKPQTISTQVQPNTPQQYSVNQPLTTTKTMSPNPVKVAKGMNPAHGQPGHRCDIAVGAPLNSKPAAVPLNKSSQVTTTTNTTQNGGFSVTPVDASKQNTPSLLTPNNTPTGTTATGTNPPHGQPGHVCGTPTTTTTPTETKEVKKE